MTHPTPNPRGEKDPKPTWEGMTTCVELGDDRVHKDSRAEEGEGRGSAEGGRKPFPVSSYFPPPPDDGGCPTWRFDPKTEQRGLN